MSTLADASDVKFNADHCKDSDVAFQLRQQSIFLTGSSSNSTNVPAYGYELPPSRDNLVVTIPTLKILSTGRTQEALMSFSCKNLKIERTEIAVGNFDGYNNILAIKPIIHVKITCLMPGGFIMP
uniref:Uncharacterized protein n=1 Tax=Romanomermis culicivorax TaxID=13658 RepID=A0A915HSY0_ROMCU